MKKQTVKIIKMFPLSAILFSLLFAACDNPLIDSVLKPVYITFETNGGSYIDIQKVYKGNRIIRPGDPTKPANEFVGWYRDSALKYEWFFDAIPENDLTLYAKWDDSGITLSPPVSMDFGVKIGGYAPFDANDFTVTVSNSSAAAATGELAIELSGDNKDSFILSTDLIHSIPTFSNAVFTVVPKTGLPIGIYTASVTVRGNEEDINDNISKSIVLSFRVVKDVTSAVIVSQPAKLEYTYGQQLDLSGLTINVVYSDGSTDNNLPYSSFASADRFFSTTPAHGDNISVLEHNEQPVSIFWADRYIMDTAKLTVNPSSILSAAVSVTSPVSGKTPDTTALVAGGSNFTAGTVTWTPNDPVFIFERVYQASVTITVINGNYTFTGGLANAAINGKTAAVSDNTGVTATLSYSMETTRANIYDIMIKSPPAAVYTHGDALNLTALVVSLLYDDGTSIDAAYNSFPGFGEASESITTNLTNGTRLSHSTHNGTYITVTYENISSNVTVSASVVLTVNCKTITITGVSAVNRSYNGTATVALLGGSLQGIVSGDSVSFDRGLGAMTDENAGNNKPVTASISLTGNDAENYTLIQPANITVTISRALLTIAGVEHTKEYDSNVSFAAPYLVFLTGIFDGDEVNAAITAVYTNPNAGTKVISITNVSLEGSSAGNYTVTSPGNVNTGSLDEGNNFVPGGGIIKAAGAAVTVPVVKEVSTNVKGETIITIYAVSPITTTGQTVEYAISTSASASAASLNWISGTTFDNDIGKPLTNTTYFVFARTASPVNSNYDSGPPSHSSVTLHRVSLNYNIFNLPLFSVLVLRGNKIPENYLTITFGNTLEGWYAEWDGNNAYNHKWDKDNHVTEDITLYAKWN